MNALDTIADRRELRIVERFLIGSILALLVLDILSTVLAISHPRLFESNAMAFGFIDEFGATVGLTIKAILMVVVGVAVWNVIPKWTRPAFLLGVAVPHTMAVVSNILLLFQYGIL